MHAPLAEEIAALGSELNANQYKLVRLAAQYDIELEWFAEGFSSPSIAIARTLDIHSSTAREWIRVGHALDSLPLIDQEFRANTLSYAKARILTRWADPDNEQELLELAADRSANRLTIAVANYLAGAETASERDRRHHDDRSVTVHTDADGMIIIRAALPPDIGKQVAAAVNAIVQHVAATPLTDVPEPPEDASADACQPQLVAESVTPGAESASADAFAEPTMAEHLRELKRRWQPADTDEVCAPSLSQQRADAFVLLFLGKSRAGTPSVPSSSHAVRHVTGPGTGVRSVSPTDARSEALVYVRGVS